MTKLRNPLCFSAPVKAILERIGLPAAKKATGRGSRMIGYWSESDSTALPNLDQALALDRAFMDAGGGYPPLLQHYARQLDIVMIPATACTQALAADIAAVSRETAEAIADALAVMQPGASPAAINHAIAEAKEASALYPPFIARLRSFLPGNRAAQATVGVRV